MINWGLMGAWQNWALILFILILLHLALSIFKPNSETM